MPSDRRVLLVNGVVFSVVGAFFLVFPAQMAHLVTDGAPGTPSGLIDMRATYGGVLLAVGGLMLGSLKRPETRSYGLVLSIAVLGGMALGRVLGMVSDGPANLMMYLFLAYEIVFIALSALALRQH